MAEAEGDGEDEAMAEAEVDGEVLAVQSSVPLEADTAVQHAGDFVEHACRLAGSASHGQSESGGTCPESHWSA